LNWQICDIICKPRGNYKYYDNLVSEFGATGWGSKDVLPLFKMTENNSDPTVSDIYHGRGGPIGVSTPAQPNPIQKIFIDWAQTQGYPLNDINGANQSGVYLVQSTIKHGLRASTSSGYLESGICNSVTILTGALVNKILIGPDTDGKPIAYGVRFTKNLMTYTVNATKEVILSAGNKQ